MHVISVWKLQIQVTIKSMKSMVDDALECHYNWLVFTLNKTHYFTKIAPSLLIIGH